MIWPPNLVKRLGFIESGLDFSYVSPMKMQLADLRDIFEISKLYFDVYQGSYPDPLMKDYNRMTAFINSGSGFWFIAKDDADQVIASVLTMYEESDYLARASAAVVRGEYRGQGVMESLLGYAISYIKKNTKGIDVLYSTTRTVNEAAQTLTEKLNFKKLGIFPNVHKTLEYETHCLAGIIEESAFQKRNHSYLLHHELKSLFEIVRQEFHLDPLETIEPLPSSRELIEPPELEIIKSPRFVNYQFTKLRREKMLKFDFFPFHVPNMMIMSADQSVELFSHLSDDGYCVIIGVKLPENMNFSSLFIMANRLLRDAGARYIEIMARADRPKIIESILRAKFIPCAFFPAFQQIENKRHDFVVFSRSFELFDFQNVKLKGLNQVYLEEYFKNWKKLSLNPKLLNL